LVLILDVVIRAALRWNPFSGTGSEACKNATTPQASIHAGLRAILGTPQS